MFLWTLVSYLAAIAVSGLDELEVNHMTTCGLFKYKLANITSSTSSCFIRSSQPLRICQNCLPYFRDLQTNYDYMANGSLKYRDYKCLNSLLKSDLSSSISDLYYSIVTEWNDINCGNCYQVGKQEFTHEFSEFLNRSIALMSCLQSYTNASLNFLSPDFETIWIDDHFDNTSCQICDRYYKDLSKYYDQLHRIRAGEDDSNSKKLWGGLCGDMGDIMNTSQHLWSKYFGCSPRSSNFVQIVPICTIVVITLLFYCFVSTIFHDRVKTILYKQRRLKPVGSSGDEVSIQSMRSTF